jgi:membrane protease subunit HflC
MSRSALIALGVAAFAMIVILSNTLYTVDQREQAVVLRLGNPARTINGAGQDDPGLHAKVPFWENVVAFDKQNQALEVDKEEVQAADQERLVVDAFLRYRIVDPLLYFRTLGDDTTAHARLERLVSSALRERLGSVKSGDIISARRDEIMREARDEIAAQAKASRMGVQIIDLRIKRADLPAANQAAVYERMKSQRRQEATSIRAMGEQRSLEIKAAADKDVAITLATAREEAGKMQGEGEAKRAALYAQSFGKDPKFAAFYRTMLAYDKALGAGDTTMVLSPDSAFFKFMKQGPGK